MAYDLGQRLKRTGDYYLLEDTDLRGGFRIVTSIEERNAIPLQARRTGMVVRVISASGFEDWTLPVGKPISNTGWTKEGGGGSSAGVDFGVARLERFENVVRYIMTDEAQFEGEMTPEEAATGCLIFNNGVENTLEFDVRRGQIVAKLETALSSDVTLKAGFKRIRNSLAITNKINGWTFTKNIDTSGRRYVGLKAQEVQAAIPEAVTKSSDGKLAVFYGSLVGLLIENVKDLCGKTKGL